MLMASPAHSLSLFDTIKYKKVYLPYQTTCLLVNRFTKKVEYIGEEGNWTNLATLPRYSQAIYQDIADKALKLK